MKRLAINANGNMITSFAGELNPTVEYIYIYIQHIYIYIYILQQFLVVTISLDWLVVDQMQFNLESAQYL